MKSLRALRALRPLRVISKNEGLKLVVNSLFSALPAILNVMLVCFFFMLSFGIIGVNFFKGRFYSCTVDNYSIQNQTVAITNKDDCLQNGASWINSDSNFDSILRALLTLFQLITTDGWLKVSYNAVDSREIDDQPVQGYKEYRIFYFIVYIVIGNIFLLNLFVGVVIDSFNKQKEKMWGYVMLSDQQKEWIEI